MQGGKAGMTTSLGSSSNLIVAFLSEKSWFSRFVASVIVSGSDVTSVSSFSSICLWISS